MAQGGRECQGFRDNSTKALLMKHVMMGEPTWIKSCQKKLLELLAAVLWNLTIAALVQNGQAFIRRIEKASSSDLWPNYVLTSTTSTKLRIQFEINWILFPLPQHLRMRLNPDT